MRHLRLFENDDTEYKKNLLKEYFKPKIDWSIFNYLVDRITKFEDDAYDVTVLICIGDPAASKKFPIFGYSTKHGNSYSLSASVETLVAKFEEFNEEFYYRIFMTKYEHDDEEKELVYVTNFQDEFFMTELQHRFDRVEQEDPWRYDDELIIKER